MSALKAKLQNIEAQLDAIPTAANAPCLVVDGVRYTPDELGAALDADSVSWSSGVVDAARSFLQQVRQARACLTLFLVDVSANISIDAPQSYRCAIIRINGIPEREHPPEMD